MKLPIGKSASILAPEGPLHGPSIVAQIEIPVSLVLPELQGCECYFQAYVPPILNFPGWRSVVQASMCGIAGLTSL
jgi:hypothetical protein